MTLNFCCSFFFLFSSKYLIVLGRTSSALDAEIFRGARVVTDLG